MKHYKYSASFNTSQRVKDGAVYLKCYFNEFNETTTIKELFNWLGRRKSDSISLSRTEETEK